MKYFILLLIVLRGAIPESHAQFTDSVHHRVSLSATGNFNRTTDGVTMLFNNGLRYGNKFKSFVMNSGVNWIYGANPSKLTNNDFNAILDFNLYKTFPRFYYWGLLNYTTSYSLKVNHQLQTGLGVAYSIFDREDLFVNISDGILYELSSIAPSDTETVRYSTFRNSLRIKAQYNYKTFGKASVTFFHQPSLQYANDYIINANANVQIKIWKWVNFSTTFSFNRVSRTDKENMILTYGLTAERFF